MSDENWQRIREIFDSARRRKPEDRREFVVEACGADKNLLAEVESLLVSFDSAEDFMETPIVAGAADTTEAKGAKLEKGDSLGHYEIQKQIGAGGMGEVYLARDKKLDRQVAVKILNEKFAADEANLRRFVREAKAASALNHPNILVIHEIGESETAHYIVSEYVKGKTLREILNEKKLSFAEILDIATQTANALAAAHEAGLVHRDIKPENIMIRPDGFIKVLDFGLAKLVARKNQSFLDLENSTVRQNATAKGVLLGTVNYMSPEQAKSEQLDQRTDIFSLGAVIYELLAGRAPFADNSMPETFANLIHQEPPPLSNFAAVAPDELERIVYKMLRKNKDERYQTMNDLLAHLKEVRENITLGEKSVRPAASKLENTTAIIHTKTDEAIVPTVETRNGFWESIKRRKTLAGIAFAVLLIATIGFGYWFFSSSAANNRQVESGADNKPKPAPKIYWQMTEAGQLAFIQERARDIHTLIGDEPTELNETELRLIKVEIDDYVEEKDSLSQEPFEEGLRVIYGRASQYAPLVIRAFETRRVAPALGLYQAMIESEYHACPTNPSHNAPVGLFQFSRKTAAKYNLQPKDYCSIEKQSDAAAHFMSDLASDFSSEKSSATLGLLGFMIGENRVRDYLRQMRERGIMERSFWAILRSERDLQPALPEEGKRYVPRFFAAAIIGETPETFELSTPPLTTLRDVGK